MAPSDSTVLITGETGTGKELIACAVHKRSRRAGRAFISVNCAAFALSLISSELFGHEKGAFTGAVQRGLGRFELADGGKIFYSPDLHENSNQTPNALFSFLYNGVRGTRFTRISCFRRHSRSARIDSCADFLRPRLAIAKRQFSVKVGTMFEDSPLGRDRWLSAM